MVGILIAFIILIIIVILVIVWVFKTRLKNKKMNLQRKKITKPISQNVNNFKYKNIKLEDHLNVSPESEKVVEFFNSNVNNQNINSS